MNAGELVDPGMADMLVEPPKRPRQFDVAQFGSRRPDHILLVCDSGLRSSDVCGQQQTEHEAGRPAYGSPGRCSVAGFSRKPSHHVSPSAPGKTAEVVFSSIPDSFSYLPEEADW